jgi:hypothetical protein
MAPRVESVRKAFVERFIRRWRWFSTQEVPADHHVVDIGFISLKKRQTSGWGLFEGPQSHGKDTISDDIAQKRWQTSS